MLDVDDVSVVRGVQRFRMEGAASDKTKFTSLVEDFVLKVSETAKMSDAN